MSKKTHPNPNVNAEIAIQELRKLRLVLNRLLDHHLFFEAKNETEKFKESLQGACESTKETLILNMATFLCTFRDSFDEALTLFLECQNKRK